MLSQHQMGSERLHPCTFFSRKLTPAEQSNDTRNGELLAIKLTVKQWQLELKGTGHLFEVLTHHHNLE